VKISCSYNIKASKAWDRDTEGGCQALKFMRSKIKKANKVAVIVVQLATDIERSHPDKVLTLIHSLDRLLNHFGEILHVHVMEAMKIWESKSYSGNGQDTRFEKLGDRIHERESQTFDPVVNSPIIKLRY
jgi:hypothetical protein